MPTPGSGINEPARISERRADIPPAIVVHTGGTLNVIGVASWLPTDPPRPCPELLTAEEAACYLRLEGTKRTQRLALGHLRKRGVLRGVKVGLSLKYRRQALEDCVEVMQRDYRR